MFLWVCHCIDNLKPVSCSEFDLADFGGTQHRNLEFNMYQKSHATFFLMLSVVTYMNSFLYLLLLLLLLLGTTFVWYALIFGLLMEIHIGWHRPKSPTDPWSGALWSAAFSKFHHNMLHYGSLWSKHTWVYTCCWQLASWLHWACVQWPWPVVPEGAGVQWLAGH